MSTYFPIRDMADHAAAIDVHDVDRLVPRAIVELAGAIDRQICAVRDLVGAGGVEIDHLVHGAGHAGGKLAGLERSFVNCETSSKAFDFAFLDLGGGVEVSVRFPHFGLVQI